MLKPDFHLDLMRLNELPVVRKELTPALRNDPLDDLATLGEKLSMATREVRDRANSAMSAHFGSFPMTPLATGISLFEVMGFHREEVAHTRTLAWLLDPGKPHGFGSALLEIFLSHLRERAGDAGMEALAGMTLGVCLEVEAEHRLASGRRLDVYVRALSATREPWSLVIEAKVDANEGHRQLSDYHGSVTGGRAALVYLTPDGRLPKDQKDVGHWIPVSFAGVASAFLSGARGLVDAPGYPLLKMYLVGLLQAFCGIRCPVNDDALSQPFAVLQILGANRE
jgi:hypothetical protein